MQIFYLFIIIILIIVGANAVKSGNKFRDSQKQLVVGMSTQQVLEIMGQPSYVKNHENGSYEYIYEKSEWKGVYRGGTKTRRVECVFSSQNILISIGRNKNCDMSGW